MMYTPVRFKPYISMIRFPIRRFFIFFTLFYPMMGLTQPVFEFPQQITIYVNDTLYTPSDVWFDSLSQEAQKSKICYVIIGTSSTKSSVLTHIQLPQIISLKQVLRQVVLYYSMIAREKDRIKEKVNIYTYFQSNRSAPMLTVTYSKPGVFKIQLRKWDRIPVPSAPTPEEKAVFNQVLQTAFQEVQTFSSISESVFKKVALRNSISVKVVKNIYQNVTLWQQAQSLGCLPKQK